MEILAEEVGTSPAIAPVSPEFQSAPVGRTGGPPAFAYDRVRYPGAPFAQTHPGRLATLALLHGMKPASPAHCRVFELGCGDGANLIPMAYQFPDSTFLGVDLSAPAIEVGRKTIDTLGLRNIELRTLDIADVTPELGRFDYIISHGVYSWVPAAIRAKMLSIFRANLAPQGVVFVSYNCHPGSYLRDLTRAVMLFHVRDNVDPEQRVQQARMLLQVLAEIAGDKEIYGLVLRSQFERVRKTPDAVLYHDDLDAGSEAFFLHQVVEDASRQGLQYLSDASIPILTDQLLELQGQPEPVIQLLKQIPVSDWVTREQYLDFAKGRMFRETLFCHHEVQLKRPIAPDRIRDLQLSSDVLPGSADLDPQKSGPAEFKTRAGQKISTDHRLGKAALIHLGEVWPNTIGFNELVDASLMRLGSKGSVSERPSDEEIESLVAFVLRTFCAGVVDLEAFPAPLVTNVSERPEVSLLVRRQLESGSLLTNLRHCAVMLDDPVTRRLVTLADGTRTIDQLVSDLSTAVAATAQDNSETGATVSKPVVSRENVLANLRLLARLALLVA
jgi:2-polyprenyl-3-methyl-5-hydroxy-6-metoxy-1,4-benzoquinol methylase